MFFQEVPPIGETIELLINFSKDWEKENITYGYRANTAEDLAGNRIFLAYDGSEAIGYLFGHCFKSKQLQSIMPENTECFEVEELYISPAYRSKGVGKDLFSFVEKAVKNDAKYILLSTATKNWKAVLHFYLDEVEMSFHSARLFKKLC